MQLKQILATSFIIPCLSYCLNLIYNIKFKIKALYDSSMLRSLTQTFAAKSLICLRNSQLTKLNEPKAINIVTLEQSISFRYLSNFKKILKKNLFFSLEKSRTIQIFNTLKGDFYFSPLLIFGLVVISTVTSNAISSILLHQGLSLSGWLVRASFFILGIICMLNSANRDSIIQYSNLLRWLKK